jgi:hypothetical protein
MADGPPLPRFIKQYGARRTGTNYLRAHIRFNDPEAEVVPLMHILRDEHAPPPPFDEMWRRAPSQDDWPFVQEVRFSVRVPVRPGPASCSFCF